MTKKNYRLETVSIHGGLEADPATGSRALPIYQTNAYQFNNTEHAADLFGLKEQGYIYTRIGNPTVGALEERVAQLEGGVGALALSSGMAAITAAIFNVAEVGDEIISASTLYGGTYNCLRRHSRNMALLLDSSTRKIQRILKRPSLQKRKPFLPKQSEIPV